MCMVLCQHECLCVSIVPFSSSLSKWQFCFQLLRPETRLNLVWVSLPVPYLTVPSLVARASGFYGLFCRLLQPNKSHHVPSILALPPCWFPSPFSLAVSPVPYHPAPPGTLLLCYRILPSSPTAYWCSPQTHGLCPSLSETSAAPSSHLVLA